MAAQAGLSLTWLKTPKTRGSIIIKCPPYLFHCLQQVDDEMKLLKYQRRLEEELHKPYVDLPLHQTVYKLIIDNNHKMAETLRKEFRIPERRWVAVKLQNLGTPDIIALIILKFESWFYHTCDFIIHSYAPKTCRRICKQCRPWSDSSLRSHLIWIYFGIWNKQVFSWCGSAETQTRQPSLGNSFKQPQTLCNLHIEQQKMA